MGDPISTTTPEHPRGAMLRAYDKATGAQVGAVLMPAPQSGSPMTYAVDGKQYIAIATGLTRNQIGRLANSPEMKNLAKNATMLFVFGL
jgi:glucose dehydrogenase